MSILQSRTAREASARLALVSAAALVQRPVQQPTNSGSDHLPERYDRDAVQVALDSLVARINQERAP